MDAWFTIAHGRHFRRLAAPLVGLPVLVQGYYIAIPRGQFVIAEGCSGVRYLTSNLLLLFFYSLLNRYSIYQFLLGLLVTVSLALLMNWIRVVTIILFGRYFGIEHTFCAIS